MGCCEMVVLCLFCSLREGASLSLGFEWSYSIDRTCCRLYVDGNRSWNYSSERCEEFDLQKCPNGMVWMGFFLPAVCLSDLFRSDCTIDRSRVACVFVYMIFRLFICRFRPLSLSVELLKLCCLF